MAENKKKKLRSQRLKNKLPWSWPAFLLGPIWYLSHGIWRPALIMGVVLLMSGFILVFPIAIYCAIRFEEDLHEQQGKNGLVDKNKPKAGK
ncbi:DUF2628 domain-containing protein [Candidatus Margulisiibacteriota bacterium]